MKITSETALNCSKIIRDFFNDFKRIDDYFRIKKIERVKDIPTPIPGFSIEDDMFQNYDMSPEEMDIDVAENKNEVFDTMLEKVASFTPEQAPGKELKLLIKEKNTNTVIGFIKLASPMINSKPRNEYLNGTPELSIFNKRAIMGFIIVPVQPFGFNYLGGKLLALICCSHKVREMLNKKYNTEFCLFETTSLYGNIKGTSMYDGLKPFLRYKGDTQSKFIPSLGDEQYTTVKKIIEKEIGGEIIHKGASSRKLKITQKIISLIKLALKDDYKDEHNQFVKAISNAEGITTQKRFYMSDYGYENVKDVLLGKTNTLSKGQNFDKHSLENIINWWKKKATSRYNNLKSENKVRKKLEVWNSETMNDIDIIR